MLRRTDNQHDNGALTQSAMPVFSYFRKPITNIYPLQVVSLVEVYQRIHGQQFAQATTTLRHIEAPQEARSYKANQFDYVTFSGTFSKRNEQGLLAHSGLLCLDFDQVADIDKLKGTLRQDPYFETALLFVSPSGKGLKWVIAVELNSLHHEDYFKAVNNYLAHTYLVESDTSGKDVARACFLPHDPQVFIHPQYL